MRGLALLCTLLLTACTATTPHQAFEPLAFLKNLNQVGEGTCRLVDGTPIPCKSFEDEQTGLTYVALYHPVLHNLVAIKELRPDGTSAHIWNRPAERQVVPATKSGPST